MLCATNVQTSTPPEISSSSTRRRVASCHKSGFFGCQLSTSSCSGVVGYSTAAWKHKSFTHIQKVENGMTGALVLVFDVLKGSRSSPEGSRQERSTIHSCIKGLPVKRLINSIFQLKFQISRKSTQFFGQKRGNHKQSCRPNHPTPRRIRRSPRVATRRSKAAIS